MATRGVNPDYQTATAILTRRGGIFWGLVLVILGMVWFAANLLNVALDFNIILPLLVVIAGLYLLITKVARP